MNPSVEGYKKFRRDVFPKEADRFRALARSQTPHTLFITCADSRVTPAMLTQTKPGELFQCRVVGNLIPAHGSSEGGVASSVEYAVMVLNVAHVIVCGHSDCGAMRAFSQPETLSELKTVQCWIEHVGSAIAMARELHGNLTGEDFLAALTKENIISQLQHLKTHPCVASRLRKRTLEIHGWYYDIGEGTVQLYDESTGTFRLLDSVDQELPAEVA